MPYIPQNARISAEVKPLNGAELNYAISKIVHEFIENYGLSYKTIAEAGFALEGAKLEFHRTVVGPYEDLKRKRNGSISSLDEVPKVPKIENPKDSRYDRLHSPAGMRRV